MSEACYYFRGIITCVANRCDHHEQSFALTRISQVSMS